MELLVDGDWRGGELAQNDSFWAFPGLGGIPEINLQIRLTAAHTGELLYDTVAFLSTINDVFVLGTGAQFASLLPPTPAPVPAPSSAPTAAPSEPGPVPNGMCGAQL